MKSQYTIALSMLAGIGLGALAVHGLHAQAKPPSYVVIDIMDYKDHEGFKALTANNAITAARTAALGGKYIIQTETMSALDGTLPKRFVVIAFDSKEQAQGWYDHSDIKALTAIRLKTAPASSAFIVEGFRN